MIESILKEIYQAGENFISAYNSTSTHSNKSYSRILICGMGGSGISGNYIEKLNNNLEISIIVVKEYILPYLKSSDLAVCISYSGNTEETFTMTKKLVQEKIDVIIISSGGKLKNYAKEKNIAFNKLPINYQPRVAFPFIFGTLYKLLKEILILPTVNDELSEQIINDSKNLQISEHHSKLDLFAEKIINATPIILSASILNCVALRFRCQLNENSKLFGFNYLVPEFSHNGIVGIDGNKGKNQLFVLIQAKELQNDRTNIHFNFYENDIKDKIHDVISINAKNMTFLPLLLDLTWKLDYISVIAAKIQNIDPLSIPSIVELKLKLIH